MIDKIGLIPIRDYLCGLDRRCYSKEMAIQYTKDIYGLDISKEIEEYNFFDYVKNVYDNFDEKYPPKYKDDGSREYFNNIGRKRYEKFYRGFKESEGMFDILIDWCAKSSVIHHIFPLQCGGDSNLLNLIPITKFNHELLHMNPLEHSKKCCYMAVDYLHYIWHGKFNEIINKYNIKGYLKQDIDNYKLLISENSPQQIKEIGLMLDVLEICIKNEMKEFYEYLINNLKECNV